MAKFKIKRGLLVNLPALSSGELAFTTDNKKLHIGTATGNYIPADMRQADYDTDNDGKVNSAVTADTVPWGGVTATPTTLAGYGILDGGGVPAEGATWETRLSAFDNVWYSVCYGNGLFVAIAQSGIGNRVMTSPDGINWTIRTSAADLAWTSICYGNGLFVAVAASGIGNRVMTSPNGINWTLGISAADNDWYSVCYGNGLFVAVSNTGIGNRVMTSPDGIIWTTQTSAADNSWYSVCYGNGLFVAVATSGIGNRVMTSSNGILWTIRSSAADNQWRSICYANGLFVAVSNTGIGNRVMTSPNGITWTIRASATDNDWYSVCYGNGAFVAISNTGIGNRVMSSSDGITWSIHVSSIDNNWYGICYGNGLFVAVAITGNNTRVMTSSAMIKTEDYNALDVLGKIKTVDGIGSGLDTDLVQGALPATASTVSTIAKRDASGNLTAKSLISDVAIGTAPLIVTSTTKVTNLNVDQVDGLHTATASTVSTIAARDASGNLTAKSLISDVAIGTAPLTVTSTTKVANLNSDLHDGRHIHELDQYNLYRSSKDINGIFTQVDYKRYDNTLFATSILSGGTTPSYTTRTVTYYDLDGITILTTKIYTISYDIDEEIISEIVV